MYKKPGTVQSLMQNKPRPEQYEFTQRKKNGTDASYFGVIVGQEVKC